jgi:hypothetical protein
MCRGKGPEQGQSGNEALGKELSAGPEFPESPHSRSLPGVEI